LAPDPIEPLREPTQDEREHVASNARRLRDDAGFILAVESAKERIMQEIIDTAPADVARREALYAEVRALLRLDGRLKSLSQSRPASIAHRSVA
jgi:hypothetical protein